jgi:diacylglycerol kinase
MKIHIFIALCVLFCSWLFQIEKMEFLIVLGASCLVLCLEIVNTAIEKMVDILSPEYHKSYGEVKDLAAGAVLLAAIFAFVVGMVIFFPKIWYMVNVH